MELGTLKGPIVVPINAQPRENYQSSYFFTPSFFMDADESSSVESLIAKVKADVESVAAISQQEYDSFNQVWSIPQNAFFGRYDYVKVSYDYVSFEVRRMVSEVLGASIPESDLSALILEIIRCTDGQVLKVFDSNQWAHSTDNMLTNSLGVLAATCGDKNVELFTYYSKIQASAKIDITTISPETRKLHKQVLGKWLALHFVREFNN
jgi:hypothetical protein